MGTSDEQAQKTTDKERGHGHGHGTGEGHLAVVGAGLGGSEVGSMFSVSAGGGSVPGSFFVLCDPAIVMVGVASITIFSLLFRFSACREF